MTPQTSRNAILTLLACVAVIAVGTLLRLWQLPDQLLLDDEWHAVRKLTRAGFRDILTSFGSSDHSIPLTAYYNAISRWGGALTEWHMRFPLLLAGLATIPVIPWLMRPFTTGREQLIATALLATSPLLIYFSRQARPYALSTLLACIAIVAFWQWWRLGDRRWAMAYVACTALAAWLLPLTLAFTLAPFVVLGIPALWQAFRAGNRSAFNRLAVIGVATLVPLLLLLGPPVVLDFEALSGKAGSDLVTLQSAVVALELFLGASHPGVTITGLGLATLGAHILWRREPYLAAYLGAVAVIGLVLIVSTNAAWINHGLVLARYLLPLQPLLLVLIAIGFAGALRPLPAPLLGLAVSIALLVLYALGPIPAQYQQPINQLTSHAAYHFDYDFDRSAYRTMLPRGPAAPFHQQLAELPPGSITLIAMPWYLESHWNRWHYEQKVHRQRLLIGFASGYCDTRVWGEYRANTQGVEFRHVARIEDVVVQPAQHEADYLIFQKHAWEPADPALDEWLGNRERLRPLRNLDSCLEQLRDDLGPPVFEDRAMAVFSLGEDPADAASLQP